MLIQVNKEWCKGCALCVDLCPRAVLIIGEDGHSQVDDEENCSECALCELRCPDLAIELRGEDDE